MQFLLFFISLTLSALLFSVQPMASKMLLPILGGTPAVWTTAMFTFQLLLLAGYFYAHAMVRLLKPWCACLVHGVLFVASLTLLPLAVTLTSDASLLASPALSVVQALALQVGLPFVLLSATQPLLQAWLAGSRHSLSAHPHVLYSASNLGSFIGLIGYVVLAEPMLTLSQQRVGWSIAYVAGIVLMLVAGSRLSRLAVPLATAQAEPKQAMSWQRVGAWIGLAFLASSLSLGVTTYVTTDVASMPLLWVIPLGLYLLSFVDAFRLKPQLVPICQRIAPLVGLSMLVLYVVQGQRFSAAYILHFAGFGVLACALHGWLAGLRPAKANLTAFYLCLSLGGAFGGLVNGLLAPLMLRSPVEYPMVLLIACIALQMLRSQRDHASGWRYEMSMLGKVATFVPVATFLLYYLLHYLSVMVRPGDESLSTLQLAGGVAAVSSLILFRGLSAAFYSGAMMLCILIFGVIGNTNGQKLLFQDRNFFGVERVTDNAAQEARYLTHDTTVHGVQSLRADDRLQVLSYYLALQELFVRLPRLHTQRLATVGLGIGSTKCYLRPKQWMDFYEINPMVQQLAEDKQYFTLLSDCPGEHQVLLGDGRIRLGEQSDGRYGMIVLDAFSSDAIPVHLLTQEALKLYFDKLAPHGVLMMHTTNRHINLWPVIGAHADTLGYAAYGKFFSYPENARLKFRNHWVVMARDPKDLAPLLAAEEGWQKLHGDGGRVWTDQYVSILPYLKMFRHDAPVQPKQ